MSKPGNALPNPRIGWTWQLGLLAAIAISAAVWWPMTLPGFDFARTDDGEHHLLRLFLLDHSLRAGLWYPRWLPDLFMGFGYPLFNFYAPLTYYLGAIFIRLGLDTYGAWQAVAAGAVIAGTAGTYVLTTALWGTIPRALFAAAAYVLAPYPFLANLYIRGAVPEVWGVALVPWVLWAGLRVHGRGNLALSVTLAVVLSSLVLLHNLTALIGAGLLLLWAAALAAIHRRIGGVRAVAAAVVVASGLTAFFWLPALGERSLVQFELAFTSYEEVLIWLYDPLKPVERLFDFAPPYNQTPVGPIDLHAAYPYTNTGPIKPSLGQAVLWGVGLLGVVVLLWRRDFRRAGLVAFFLILAASAWWLTTRWSQGAWEVVAPLRTLQFPYRLHSLVALGVAVGGAAAVPRSARLAFPLCGVLALLLGWQALAGRPWPGTDQSANRVVDGARLRLDETDRYGGGTASGGEFLPRSVWWAIYTPGIRRGNAIYERTYPEREWTGGLIRTHAGTLDVNGLYQGPNWVAADVAALTPATLAFRRIDFPEWRAFVDGQKATVYPVPYDPGEQAELGFLLVDVPAGQHRVWLQFRPSALRLAAQLITAATLASAGVVFLVLIWRRVARGQFSVALTAGSMVVGAGILSGGVLMMILSLGAVQPPPRQPPAASSILALDIVGEVLAGRAHLASPSGPTLGTHLDLRRLALQGRDRAWLYAHPESEVTVTLTVPPLAWLETALALHPDAWETPVGDGVEFSVEVRRREDAKPQVIWRQHLNPRAHSWERRWNEVRVDLRRFAGQTVELTLRTDFADEASYDWAGWGTPIVVVDRSARSHEAEA
ncbi:MAG: hypothetical protein CL878_10990 [Dehalococcoidia bacterium]|nr:hypothetical protein [Dehalococcoidia bacterium]